MIEPVIAAIAGCRVDDPGNVSACRQHEGDFTSEQARAGISGLPGDDVVFPGREHVGGRVDPAEIHGRSAHGQAAWHAKIVFQVHITYVIDVHRPR
ncbi:hypothetical protein D3C83_16780 [compost metagenome]